MISYKKISLCVDFFFYSHLGYGVQYIYIAMVIHTCYSDNKHQIIFLFENWKMFYGKK